LTQGVTSAKPLKRATAVRIPSRSRGHSRCTCVRSPSSSALG